MDSRVCIICGAASSDDNEGLEICGKVICPVCEEKIVSSAVYDKSYSELIDKLKKLWAGLPAQV